MALNLEWNVTRDKAALRTETMRHIETGGEGLSEEKFWMAGVHLDRLDGSSGERERYCLLSVQTAEVTRATRRAINAREV
ncbi:hypothetical protein ACHAW6_001797 [Cyclotella cf. meneghiniana]